MLKILSNAPTDTESWYHLWEVSVALNAICVRAGRRGTADRLGWYTLAYHLGFWVCEKTAN